MRSLPRTSVFLALLIPLLQSIPRPALAAEPEKPWRVAYDRCQKLSNDGDYTTALEACEQAYSLNPDPGILAYIAQIQTALLHPVQAREALDRYLRSGPVDDADRKTAEAQIRYLETRISTLLVTTSMQGAEIRVDDQVIDRGSLAQGVQLMAGAHQITLQAQGETFNRFVVLRGGERTQLELPGPGSITLSCAVPETRFFIDDRELDAGQASRGVPRAAGNHRVTFKAGSNAWLTETVLVSPDQVVSVVCTPSALAQGTATRPGMNPRGYWVTGAGLSLGIAALVTAIYNGNEYDRWQTANESLRSNQSKLEFDQFKNQAADNDQLMENIQTRRKVAIGLGIAGGLVTAGGVALLFHDSTASTRQGSNSWLRSMASGLRFNGATSSGEIAWGGTW